MNEENKKSQSFLNESNNEGEEVPKMILTIDVGNGKIEQLKIFNLINPEKDIYEFCMNNKLDYYTMEEITKQIHDVIDSKNKEIEHSNQQIEENNKLEKNTNDINKMNDMQYQISESDKIESKPSKSLCTYNQKRYQTYLNTNSDNSANSMCLFPYQISHSSTSEKGKLKQSQSKKSAPSKLPSNQKHKTETSNPIPLQAQNQLSEPVLTISSHNIIDPTTLIENEIVKTENNQYFISPVTKKSAENKKEKKKKVSKNIGAEIYERQLKAKEEEKRRLETLKDTLNESDEEIYTFHPKINRISEEVLSKRQANKSEFNNPERILKYKQYYEEKLARTQTKISNLNSDKDNCTFRPKICSNSNTIEERKQNSSNSPRSRFEKLYNDQNVIRQNLSHLKTEIDEQYSYKPKLNDTSRIKESFIERLNKYKSKSSERKIKIQSTLQEDNQKECVFHPTLIAKRSNNQRINVYNQKNNSIKSDIFTTLYLYNQKYKQNKKNLERKIYDYKLESKTCKQSSQLIGDKRKKIFKELFYLLDSDGDNLLTSISININRIPNNIKKILEPIILELKEENETLNEIEFVSVCEQLYQLLPYDKKREFIVYGKSIKGNKNNNKTFTFKPIINKSTRRTIKDEQQSRELLKDISNISKIRGEVPIEGQINTLSSKA